MSNLPFDWRNRFLLSSRIFEEISLKKEWHAFKKNVGRRALEYPDGSVEVDADDSGDAATDLHGLFQTVFAATSKKRQSEGRDSGRQGFQTQMRSISGFRENLFTLWYPDSLQLGLDDQSLLIVPEAWSEITPEEQSHSNFQVSFLLMNTPNEGVRRTLGSLLKDWSETVSVRGIHGEGGIRVLRDSIEWRGRVARILLDISKSGQSTVNWLVLWLVRNVSNVPIEMIALGNNGGPIFQKPLRKKPTFEAFPSERIRRVVPPSQNPLVILLAEEFGLERVIVITFCEQADLWQRKEAVSLIEAWLLAGSRGGYGGAFHYNQKPKWSNDHMQLTVIVDIGDANPQEAIRVLKNLLQSLSSETLRIAKIEFNPE